MSRDRQPATTCLFEFDTGLYRLAAIKKAAYRFGGQFSVQITQISDSRVGVSLQPLHGKGQCALDVSSFPNEVLDQELREAVADETKSVRELLLAQAFSSFSLIDPVGERADFRDDPLLISKSSQDVGVGNGTEEAAG